jgi:ATP-dependent Lon protease
MRGDIPGVATGLAWTPVGGDILFIEAARTPGNGRLILTGQLGDVMKESAQAALSLVEARAETLGISAEALEKSDIHVHVPAGATPKDGPSAGVAMFVALTSLRPVGPCLDVAMTGEISLRGLVLPIGGVKEKVLAAPCAGITSSCCLRATGGISTIFPRTHARSSSSYGWSRSMTRSAPH